MKPSFLQRQSRSSRSVIRWVVTLTIVFAVAATVSAAASGDIRAVEDEPAAAAPAELPVEMASGVGRVGDEWTAAKYENVAGDICVDVMVVGPSTKGIETTFGGCFAQGLDELQHVRSQTPDASESMVVGLLDDSPLELQSSRDVVVHFQGGDVRADVFDDGLFIAAGKGLSTSIRFEDGDGELRTQSMGGARDGDRSG